MNDIIKFKKDSMVLVIVTLLKYLNKKFEVEQVKYHRKRDVKKEFTIKIEKHMKCNIIFRSHYKNESPLYVFVFERCSGMIKMNVVILMER